MLNRILSVCWVTTLLVSSLPLAPRSATTPAAIAAQPPTPASPTVCASEKTALLETLILRLGGPLTAQFRIQLGVQPGVQLTPQQVSFATTLLQHQLRLIAQLPLRASQINPLSDAVAQVGTLAALPSLSPAHRAELQTLSSQLTRLITRIGTEHSATKVERLTQLARSLHSLGQTAQAATLLQQARQTVATVRGNDFKTQALLEIVKSYAEIGNREAAIATLDAALPIAQGITDSPAYTGKRDDSLSRVVTLYSQLEAFPQAIAVANTLQAATAQSYAQVSLVQALLGRQQLDLALQVADIMRQSELKAWALSIIANDYGAKGQDRLATAMFKTAFATAQQRSNPHLFSPNLMAAQVVQAYGKWQPDDALALTPSLTYTPSRALALLAIATTYRDRNRGAEANALFAKVLPLVQKFTVDQHRTIGNSMIGNASEAKFYDWAMQMANLMPLTTEAGNLREVWVGQVIYTAMEQGQLAEALQGIDQLPAGSEARKDWVDRAIALALKQGKRDHAEQIVQVQLGASAGSEWMRAQQAIALFEQQSGQIRAAQARLDNIAQRIKGLTGPAQQGQELLRLVAAYSRMGEADLAAQHFADVMQRVQATNGNPSTQPAFFVGSTQPLLEARQYEWAYQLAQAVPAYELQTPEPVMVMEAVLQQHNFDLAERLIPTTRSPEIKTQLFVTLADHYMAIGESDRALATLTQAVAAARTIPDPEVRTTGVMGAGAYDYNDFSDRASQLEAIAQRYMYLRQTESAQRTLSLIETVALRHRLEQRLRCQ